MRTGLMAGSLAAVIASLVSLPLHSPSDVLMNSATVTLGALAAGVIAGLLWIALSRFETRPRIFAAVWALGLGVVVLAALVGESQLQRTVSFVVPLAAIICVLTGVATAMLSRRPVAARWWPVAFALVVALALGFGLMGQGDQESGRLTLPPRTELTLPSAAPGNESTLPLVRPPHARHTGGSRYPEATHLWLSGTSLWSPSPPA